MKNNNNEIKEILNEQNFTQEKEHYNIFKFGDYKIIFNRYLFENGIYKLRYVFDNQNNEIIEIDSNQLNSVQNFEDICNSIKRCYILNSNSVYMNGEIKNDLLELINKLKIKYQNN